MALFTFAIRNLWGLLHMGVVTFGGGGGHKALFKIGTTELFLWNKTQEFVKQFLKDEMQFAVSVV